MTMTLAGPHPSIAASASAIESAPPEQASPNRPGPSRSPHALTTARRMLTGSFRTCCHLRVVGMANSTMSERDDPNGPLPSGPLARLRAQLAGPRGYRRIDALLSSDNALGAVGQLSPNEVFELVHEVGFEDAQALIELA